MFHLVKDAYLHYEEHFDYTEDCMYISKNDHYEYNENISKMLLGEFKETSPRMYQHANSVKELAAELGGDQKLFDTLAKHKGFKNNGKIIIYCEPHSFKIFVMKWWKTLLPNLSVKEAYDLYNLYRNRAILANRDINPLKENSKELHDKYWRLDLDDFEFLYNSVFPFEVDPSVKDDASLEFHLASHYCGQTTKSFQKKVRHFYKKELIDEICECKLDIERRAYFLPKILGFASKVDFTGIDLEALKDQDPRLSFFGDKNIKMSDETHTYLSQSYNIPLLVKDLLDINSYLTSYFDGGPGLDPGSTFALQLYADKERMPTVEEVMDFENTKSLLGITGATAMDLYFISVFFKMANHNKMNLFLLQEICYLKSEKKEHELARYCL